MVKSLLKIINNIKAINALRNSLLLLFYSEQTELLFLFFYSEQTELLLLLLLFLNKLNYHLHNIIELHY